MGGNALFSLTVQFQLINVEEMIEVEKLANITVVTVLGKISNSQNHNEGTTSHSLEWLQ